MDDMPDLPADSELLMPEGRRALLQDLRRRMSDDPSDELLRRAYEQVLADWHAGLARFMENDDLVLRADEQLLEVAAGRPGRIARRVERACLCGVSLLVLVLLASGHRFDPRPWLAITACLAVIGSAARLYRARRDGAFNRQYSERVKARLAEEHERWRLPAG